MGTVAGVPADPSQLTEPIAPWPDNPLQSLSDQQLLELQHVLSLACGRSKTIFKNKFRPRFCLGWQVLESEARRRGMPPSI